MLEDIFFKEKKDKDEIKKLLENLDEAHRNNKEENVKKEIGKNLFKFEKKYLHQLNRNIIKNIKCDTLISTLGYEENPVILQILSLKPKRVIFICTEKTYLNTLPLIVKDEDIYNLIKKDKLEILSEEIEGTDTFEIYNRMEKLFKQLPKNENICIDPTGGLKIMSISTALFAFQKRIPVLYLHAEKQGKKYVQPFSERLKLINNPLKEYEKSDVELILNISKLLFNNGDISQAFFVLDEFNKKLPEKYRSEDIENYLKLIEIYNLWERSFNLRDIINKSLSMKLRKIAKDFSGNEIDKDQLGDNIKFLLYFEDTKNETPKEAIVFKIINLFINGKKQEREGHYDDSCLKFYKCLELSIKLVLLKKNYFSEVNNSFTEKIKKNNSLQLWHDKLISKNQYLDLDDMMFFSYSLGVLKQDNDLKNISLEYYKAFKEENFLTVLMDSINFHGIKSLTEKENLKLEEIIKKLVSLIFEYLDLKDFNELISWNCFPKFDMKLSKEIIK